jgi:hypothetical protein
VGCDQVVVHHLGVAPGHLQGGVPEQVLQVQRVHAGPQGERGEGPAQGMRGETHAAPLADAQEQEAQAHDGEPLALAGLEEQRVFCPLGGDYMPQTFNGSYLCRDRAGMNEALPLHPPRMYYNRVTRERNKGPLPKSMGPVFPWVLGEAAVVIHTDPSFI